MIINVIGMEYSLEVISEPPTVDSFTYGMCDYVNRVIKINTHNQPDKRIYETAKHELGHAYHFEWVGGNEFEDISEMLAEFIQRYADVIVEHATQIARYIKENN